MYWSQNHFISDERMMLGGRAGAIHDASSASRLCR